MIKYTSVVCFYYCSDMTARTRLEQQVEYVAALLLGVIGKKPRAVAPIQPPDPWMTERGISDRRRPYCTRSKR